MSFLSHIEMMSSAWSVLVTVQGWIAKVLVRTQNVGLSQKIYNPIADSPYR